MRDSNSLRLVGCRPGPDGKFFHVTLKNDTPDGTYWEPGVKIVVRTSSGWRLPRYVLTILHTVLWPEAPRVGNLFVVGAGVWRLTGFPWMPALRSWAASRGVLMSGHEQTYPCLCSTCIGHQRSSGSPGCRGGRRRRRAPKSLVSADSSIDQA